MVSATAADSSVIVEAQSRSAAEEQLVGALAQHGTPVAAIVPQVPTLEEIFLQVTA